MGDFDDLIRAALSGLGPNNPYVTLAREMKQILLAFCNAGFSREESYEMASNIILLMVENSLNGNKNG